MLIKYFIFLLLTTISVFNNSLFSEVEYPNIIIPQPNKVAWNKIKTFPYTMVVKSKKYGDFYFTQDADKAFNQYKNLCKIKGKRREIIDNITIDSPKQGIIELKCTDPQFKTAINIRPGQKYTHFVIDYPYSDYIIDLILYQENNFKLRTAECVTKYSMEIPAVGLVNKKNEIFDILIPPVDNIFLLDIQMDKVCELNKENGSLIKELGDSNLKPDQKDSIVQQIIANAIHNPLGQFCIGKKSNSIVILAEIFNQRVFLPVECIDIRLNDLLQKEALEKYFPHEDIEKISDKRILELISEKMTKDPNNAFIPLEEFPLRKDWYIISTLNTCYLTDYFINYVDIESKKRDTLFKMPIHLHPWQAIKWLMDSNRKEWISDMRIFLIPSENDLNFFQSRFDNCKFQIIAGKDPYSEELYLAVYDNEDLVEVAIKKIDASINDINELDKTFKQIKSLQGSVNRCYPMQKAGLVINQRVDSLIMLNKRQLILINQIEDYKKNRPWRQLNTSFFIPQLNKKLAEKKWQIVADSEKSLGYNLGDKEFYYQNGVTAKMDLFLFILFNLCYIESNDFSVSLKKEVYTIEVLSNICYQLDYLSLKYYHFKEFADHLVCLSNIIRYNIWQREKMGLIAEEQAINGRYYLDRYNLGYYTGTDPVILKLISESLYDESEETSFMGYKDKYKVINLEGIVTEISKKPEIKNDEEFIAKFEEQLALKTLDVLDN